MNKVEIRCKKEDNAKFYYTSTKMLKEAKAIKFSSYILPIVPIILSFIPFKSFEFLQPLLTLISFSLTLILEFTSYFLSDYKEKAIILNQLYETSICAVPFSKIEYDRELSNELNEYAIRRSLSEMANLEQFHIVEIDKDIDDEYAYLYLVRKNSATIRYLMGRIFTIFVILLVAIVSTFVFFAVLSKNTQDILTRIVQFYPLIIPLVRNISAARKTIDKCNKVSADIDSYFLGGDDSIEILARFLYYIQNIEFELLLGSPTRYKIFYKLFGKGLNHLEKGVTKRFIASVEGLKASSLIAHGINIQTSKKQKLIGDGISFQDLQKKKQRLQQHKNINRNVDSLSSIQMNNDSPKSNIQLEEKKNNKPVVAKKVDVKKVESKKIELRKEKVAKEINKKTTSNDNKKVEKQSQPSKPNNTKKK